MIFVLLNSQFSESTYICRFTRETAAHAGSSNQFQEAPSPYSSLNVPQQQDIPSPLKSLHILTAFALPDEGQSLVDVSLNGGENQVTDNHSPAVTPIQTSDDASHETALDPLLSSPAPSTTQYMTEQLADRYEVVSANFSTSTTKFNVVAVESVSTFTFISF